NIWLLDLVRGSASRFAFGSGGWAWPVWSSDGRQIVYGHDDPRDNGLYVKDASGAGDQELLLKTATWVGPTDWSRDGRFILFAQEDAKGKWDTWVLPLFGDRKPVPILQTEFNQRCGAFSPDARWIAYCSDESGRYDVYVRSFSKGGAHVAAG